MENGKINTDVVLEKNENRLSGIELLKIIGIISIVTSHLIMSLQGGNLYIANQDYALPLQQATLDPQIFMLNLMRYGGVFGNSIFFICSSWFLLDDASTRGKRARKILRLIIDIWVVSVICLVITEVIRGGVVSGRLVLRSLFPTTFKNNWYMTCYILFLVIYPFLNRIIYGLNQKGLLRCCLGLGVIYLGVDFIIGQQFYSTTLVVWIAIYFCMAYMKLYLRKESENRKVNICLVLIGVFGNVILVLLTNFLGLRVSFFSDMLLHWVEVSNPFLIIAAIGLLNLFRAFNFQSRVINRIAGLSMLVYLIHENILLKNYFRPLLFRWLYKSIGYGHILLWVLIFTFGVFLASLIFAAIYKGTIQKLSVRFSNWFYAVLRGGYGKLERLMLKEK